MPLPPVLAAHPTLVAVTRRIAQRSLPTRSAYLAQLDIAANRQRGSDRAIASATMSSAASASPVRRRAIRWIRGSSGRRISTKAPSDVALGATRPSPTRNCAASSMLH